MQSWCFLTKRSIKVKWVHMAVNSEDNQECFLI